MTEPPLLRDALLADGRRVDIAIDDGRIAAITPARSGNEGLDLGGRLLLPALVEPHAHLDKALVGPLDAAGGLRGAIDAWVRERPRRTVADTLARARAALAEYVRHGTGTVRTHVDVSGPSSLAVVAGLAELRAGAAAVVDLQVVAMPAAPLTGATAAGTRGLLLDALDAGADLVGGAPWVDDDPHAALDLLLDVAADRGIGVDLHVDETLSPDAPTLGLLVVAVEAGFDGAVTASHAVSLGQLVPDRQRDLAERMSRTGIGVVANPRSSLWLQDRATPSRARRGLTAVRALLDAGVRLAAGGDNLRDPFSPYGLADPLAIAQLLALVADVTAEEALTAVGDGARLALRRGRAGASLLPTVGNPADLVSLAASTPVDALARADPSRLVLHRGLVVSSRRLVDEGALTVLGDVLSSGGGR